MKKIIFSIIIPVRHENKYLKETRQKLILQTNQNFELLVITDKISKTANPCIKRNLGAKMAKGQYLCFIDDDSYPKQDWLENIFKQIKKHPNCAAFCGPALTPPENNYLQKASGYVWSSIMGSGGAGLYRSRISKPRFVNDYPTVNFIVKKTIFHQIGGFNQKYWPGEDTIFCLELINSNHKIFYHSSIIVYHHRREILKEHLAQTNRYAIHRGHFARVFPKNSLKIGYLIPSIFFVYFVFIPLHRFLLPLYLYLLLLSLTFIDILFKSKNIFIALLSVLTIILTHITYGYLFIIGYFSHDLKFKPRS
jgi:GT2 family glycosyltransferase